MSFERAGNRTLAFRPDDRASREPRRCAAADRRGEPRSRARVAADTGLTRGTVSSLVGELIELDLLRETGEDQRSGRAGRPGLALELSDRVVAVGLEVNVDYLAVCVEDLAGNVRYEKHVHTDNRRSAPGPVLNRLARLARGADELIAAEGLVSVGIAVALPGLVAVESGTLLRAPNLGWSGIAIADEISLRLGGVPVRVDNEANLAALAEHWQGVARGFDNFICVFAEVGVGAGIFIGGDLFRGSHGFGAELGHITVEPGGCRASVAQSAVSRRSSARKRSHVAPASARTTNIAPVT